MIHTAVLAVRPRWRWATIDPSASAAVGGEEDARGFSSAHVTFIDRPSEEDTAGGEQEEEEQDLSLMEVGVGEGTDDDGTYYDAANMPNWLVPPWVAANAPTGPLIPTYGSGYLSKTFAIHKWQGAIPPQPVFPLDTGYAGSAVDSDHFPYSGVFPNDARYHSPSLSVTAPIFMEQSAHVHALHTAHEEEEQQEQEQEQAEETDLAEADVDVDVDAEVDSDMEASADVEQEEDEQEQEQEQEQEEEQEQDQEEQEQVADETTDTELREQS